MSWSKKLFNILLITSLLFSILEIVFPELYSMVFGLEKQPRGIAGVYITSFFGARTSYAQFLLFFIFHHYSYKKEFGITSRNKLLLYLAFVLLIFAFSRKEFLFGLVFLFYFSEFRFKTKTQKYFAAVVVLGIVLISGYFYYTTFFSITNENTFSDGYSRVRLLLSAYEIIIDKFPFGSGPGTFGSQMSLNNTSIYEAYSVPEDLVYGWGDVPGPIYDIFLISFFVEYGIGLLFILMFFFKLSNRSFRNESHKKVIDFLLLYIISISFISPALMNWNGYLLLSFIGLLTSRKSFT
ncbi:O-antigen ligase family protein [Ekhidna sp.]|uniref:O-antigen ligase family protein n=1 Tax=Ekhidna sp. TaxID=2608089 RepID=UPI00329A673F